MNVKIRGLLFALTILALVSACATGGPKAGPTTPPDTLVVEEGAPGEVQILWSRSQFDAKHVLGFNIYRSDTKNGPWQRANDEILDFESFKVQDGIEHFELVDRDV